MTQLLPLIKILSLLLEQAAQYLALYFKCLTCVDLLATRIENLQLLKQFIWYICIRSHDIFHAELIL